MVELAQLYADGPVVQDLVARLQAVVDHVADRQHRVPASYGRTDGRRRDVNVVTGGVMRRALCVLLALALGGCGLLGDGGATQQAAVEEARDDWDAAIEALFPGDGPQEPRSREEVAVLLDDFEDAHRRWEDAVDAMVEQGAEPDNMDSGEWPEVRAATRDWVEATGPFVRAMGECIDSGTFERIQCLEANGSLELFEEWEAATQRMGEVAGFDD